MEPVFGALLSRAEWLARGGASGRSCHSQGCTLMPFLDLILYVTKKVVQFRLTRCRSVVCLLTWEMWRNGLPISRMLEEHLDLHSTDEDGTEETTKMKTITKVTVTTRGIASNK